MGISQWRQNMKNTFRITGPFLKQCSLMDAPHSGSVMIMSCQPEQSVEKLPLIWNALMLLWRLGNIVVTVKICWRWLIFLNNTPPTYFLSPLVDFRRSDGYNNITVPEKTHS